MAKLISADLTNNKLCILEYTTTDRQMLPFNEDAFDATIASHTYTNIGKIIFDKPITTIGKWVFCGCRSLTSVIIPESVTSIGDSVFTYCKSLKNLTIGKDVREIGDRAFKECNIDTIVCCSQEPPKLNNSFDNFENLIVPAGCEEAYANSDWGKYLE